MILVEITHNIHTVNIVTAGHEPRREMRFSIGTSTERTDKTLREI